MFKDRPFHVFAENDNDNAYIFRIKTVMRNCCKYKLLEISRLLSHAAFRTIELSTTFHQVTHLLINTTKIALL